MRKLGGLARRNAWVVGLILGLLIMGMYGCTSGSDKAMAAPMYDNDSNYFGYSPMEAMVCADCGGTWYCGVWCGIVSWWNGLTDGGPH